MADNPNSPYIEERTIIIRRLNDREYSIEYPDCDMKVWKRSDQLEAELANDARVIVNHNIEVTRQKEEEEEQARLDAEQGEG